MITKGSEWMRRTLNNSVFLALLRGREKLKSKRWRPKVEWGLPRAGRKGK